MKSTWKTKGYKSRFRQKEELGETHGRQQGEEKRERTNDQVAHMDDFADETKRAPTLEACSVMCNT